MMYSSRPQAAEFSRQAIYRLDEKPPEKNGCCSRCNFRVWARHFSQIWCL